MAGIAPYKESDWKVTNGDRIRAMTDEELAEILIRHIDCYECEVRKDGCCTGDGTCRQDILDWLRQEVKR